jgi:GNAT superfamily N-acetyltransferase
MHDLPAGWATDLAILTLSGSVIEDCGDHLVVRSPHNPDYHWGNCLFVTDEGDENNPDRWVAAFNSAFPEADWIAMGLMRMPDDPDAWTAHELDLELDEVLSNDTLPPRTPAPSGYTIRRLAGDDWERSVARELAENRRTGEFEAQAHERFARAQAQTQRDFSEREVGARFGAFAGDELVAELGIVRCGTTARYQSVASEEEHRRQGLASHLLGVAAEWASHRGCDRWVIVTEAANPAGRVYRRAGFRPDTAIVTAYRPPRLA